MPDQRGHRNEFTVDTDGNVWVAMDGRVLRIPAGDEPPAEISMVPSAGWIPPAADSYD
ncbi:hypothetical protein [Nocardia brasiliensis]